MEVSMIDWLSAQTYDEPLAFVAILAAGMVLLIIWAFRTPQVSWRVRVVYQLCVVALAARPYLIRVQDVQIGWVTNLLSVAFIAGSVMLLGAVLKDSGLFGRRRVPMNRVP
jgi:hypothetical protein